MLRAFAVVLIATAAATLTGCAQRSAPEPSATTAPPRPVAVFIGDSYTQGAGATDQAHGFASLLAAAEGWKAINLGRGGTGYATVNVDGLHACGLPFCGDYGDSIATAVAARPAVILVSGGLNDSNQPTPTFASAVDQFMDTLASVRSPSTRVYVTSPLTPGGSIPSAFGAEAPIVEAAAVSHGFGYLDLGQPIENRRELQFTDHVHPNDRGHALLAELIQERIAAAP